MEVSARGGIISGVAPILILLLLASPAAAQDPKPRITISGTLSCATVGSHVPEPQINGCTALIDSGEHTPTAGYRL